MGDLFITTAGHCAGPDGRLSTSEGSSFASIVVQEEAGIGQDLIIARIDPEWRSKTSSAMRHFGGATGAAREGVPGGIYQYYGGGQASGADHPPARWGVELLPPVDFLIFEGRVSPGDSGAPVRSAAGFAMGIVTHRIAIDSPTGADVGGAGTTLDAIVQAGAAAGLILELAAATG